MPLLELLDSQRFAVGELITAAGLRLHDFAWERTYTQVQDLGPGQEPVMVSRLVHRATQFFFVFDVDEGGRHLNHFRPGATTTEAKSFPGSWENQLGYVARWLNNIRRELATPDLWEAVQEEVRELPSGGDDTPFSPAEQAELERHLRGVLETVKERHELTAGQLEGLEEKVDYLVAEAARARRFEWRRLMLGSLIEAMVVYGLEADAFRDLMRLAVTGVAHLFGGPPLLTP